MSVFSNYKADTSEIFIFQKQELNTGFIYNGNIEREEEYSSVSYNFEELTYNSAQLGIAYYNWNILSFKQEEWYYSFEAGPFTGQGNFRDSSSVYEYRANHKVLGLKGIFSGGYVNRFYYDRKNYTLVSVTGQGRFSYFRQDAEGIISDTNQVVSDHNEKSMVNKFRIGLQAKAGWGLGRLNNINHYVTAAGLLRKFYPKRLFSESEIIMLSREIAKIKNHREPLASHESETETKVLGEFLNWKMLLEIPTGLSHYWDITEFKPRYRGTRFEFGPFFNYYNREPDFIYGGYARFEKLKYCNLDWNRNLSAGISYNRYKHHDWFLLETDLGWTYYHNLKSEFNFGIRYLPGFIINDIDDFEPVRHSFIPYLEYFSQINSRWRLEAEMALRIAPVAQFVVPGPQFSVSIYRSRY